MNIAAKLSRPGTIGYSTDIAGYSHAIYEQYTACNRIIISDMLNIFDKCELEYYLFAGSMGGYVRNKQMPPWLDDMDVIVFEDQIEHFKSVVVPALTACGFGAQLVDAPLEEGGFHFTAMRLANTRHAAIPLSESDMVIPPWAQIDVFFSKVDTGGFVRNLTGWGLYHLKNIPVGWVKPGTYVTIEGIKRRVFSEYQKDIELEYGDVRRNVVVQTHDRVFLRQDNVPWHFFEHEWRAYIEQSTQSGLPGISQVAIDSHQYDDNRSYDSIATESLACIVRGIVKKRASFVRLSGEVQLMWAMDIRRMFPEISVVVSCV
jgi:hypothetical protein